MRKYDRVNNKGLSSYKMQNEISNKPWGLVRPLNKSDVHLALGYMCLGEERKFYES